MLGSDLRARLHPHRLLMWTLGISVLIHLSLLTFRLAAPQAYQRVFQDTPLEITLVNARSTERPEQPQALAQTHLAGGGKFLWPSWPHRLCRLSRQRMRGRTRAKHNGRSMP